MARIVEEDLRKKIEMLEQMLQYEQLTKMALKDQQITFQWKTKVERFFE